MGVVHATRPGARIYLPARWTPRSDRGGAARSCAKTPRAGCCAP